MKKDIEHELRLKKEREIIRKRFRERLEYERRQLDIDKKNDGQSYLDFFQLD